jgi:hypothetical protein
MNGLSGERAGPLSADDEVPQPARAGGVPGTPRRERFCARFRAALMPFLLVVCTGALGAGEEAPDTRRGRWTIPCSSWGCSIFPRSP